MAFQEEIVDIHPHIIMIEGQVLWTNIRRCWLGCEFRCCTCHVGLLVLLKPALEEARPTLLQKAEEGLPIWHYALQGPVLKLSVLPQELHEVGIKHGRDAPLAVMSPQENAEQIGRLLHQLGGDVKDMSEYEIFGVIIPQCPRTMPPLGTVEGVEITALQCRDNRITQVGEQVSNGKGALLTGLQEVIGQAAEFCCPCPQNHVSFGALPRPQRLR